MTKIKTFLHNFAKDESGASAAEYALILAIVGAGIAGAAIFLGEAIADAVGDAACIISEGNPGSTATVDGDGNATCT